jgi:ring-1,2-phenylacetyl-CoA epoxidase subunit PaaD
MRPGDAAAGGASVAAPARATIGQIWTWLGEVADPEIPVISVVDLGIVRDVRWEREGARESLVVTVTPTYSGCPATSVIASDITTALEQRGIDALRIETRLSPAWTTDWLSAAGRQRLREFGIAPPGTMEAAVFPLKRLTARLPVECPRCGSANTAKVSEFGSTPCKSQYRCADCLEPFDYFKCI